MIKNVHAILMTVVFIQKMDGFDYFFKTIIKSFLFSLAGSFPNYLYLFINSSTSSWVISPLFIKSSQYGSKTESSSSSVS